MLAIAIASAAIAGADVVIGPPVNVEVTGLQLSASTGSSPVFDSGAIASSPIAGADSTSAAPLVIFTTTVTPLGQSLVVSVGNAGFTVQLTGLQLDASTGGSITSMDSGDVIAGGPIAASSSTTTSQMVVAKATTLAASNLLTASVGSVSFPATTTENVLVAGFPLTVSVSTQGDANPPFVQIGRTTAVTNTGLTTGVGSVIVVLPETQLVQPTGNEVVSSTGSATVSIGPDVTHTVSGNLMTSSVGDVVATQSLSMMVPVSGFRLDVIEGLVNIKENSSSYIPEEGIELTAVVGSVIVLVTNSPGWVEIPNSTIVTWSRVRNIGEPLNAV